MHRRTESEREFPALRRAASLAQLIDVEEEQRLARQAQAGDAAAFDRLVRSHLRLVYSIASEYQRFGASLDDLVSEGALGLVIAARRFDPDRGTRLATYAALWIRAHLRRYSLSTRRMVGPPSTRNGRFIMAKLARTERELTTVLGEMPEPDAVAAHLGVSRGELDQVHVALRTRDAFLGERSKRGGTVLELPSDEPSPEAVFERLEEQREARALLDEGFEQLGTREREIVRTRLLELDPPSLSTLAVKLGVSRERVRQIEARGYHKLRDAVLDCVA